MAKSSQKTIHQVLARKWRPQNFADVVGQQHVLLPLTNSIGMGTLHHAYLLTGTRGVGKTSLARILAKAICCENRQKKYEPCGKCPVCTQINQGRYLDLIEVDAASRSKVEETRELIESLHYTPSGGNHRVYIIDEVHMFSRHSFNALLKVLEEPPDHVTFILATTERKKIPNTVLSRCLQFHLKHLKISQIVDRLEVILKAEKIAYDEKALLLIAKSARGSLRDALSLLDQAIGAGSGQVKLDLTEQMIGSASIDQALTLVQHLLEQNLPAIVEAIDSYAEQSLDCEEVLDQTIGYLQNLALLKSYPKLAEQDSFQLMFANVDTHKLIEQVSAPNLHLYEHIATDTRTRFWVNPFPEQALKLCFSRMLLFAHAHSHEPKPEATKPQNTPIAGAGAAAKTAKPQNTPIAGAGATTHTATTHAGPPTTQQDAKPPAAQANPSQTQQDDIPDLASATPSAAMRLWGEVVAQLEKEEVKPLKLALLSSFSEVLQTEKGYKICYLQKLNSETELLERTKGILAKLAQTEAIELAPVADISTSLSQLKENQQKLELNDRINKFRQDPVVQAIKETLKVEEVKIRPTHH